MLLFLCFFFFFLISGIRHPPPHHCTQGERRIFLWLPNSLIVESFAWEGGKIKSKGFPLGVWLVRACKLGYWLAIRRCRRCWAGCRTCLGWERHAAPQPWSTRQGWVTNTERGVGRAQGWSWVMVGEARDAGGGGGAARRNAAKWAQAVTGLSKTSERVTRGRGSTSAGLSRQFYQQEPYENRLHKQAAD